MKLCRKCKLFKNIDEFRKTRRKKDGLQDWCKDCCKKYDKLYYTKNKDKRNRQARNWAINNPEKRFIIEKKYRESEKGKKALYENCKKYSKKYPNRRNSYNKVRRNLKKQPCEMCGNTDKVEAHHEDYEKPLDVIWLCSKHHKEIHRPGEPNF